MERNKTPGSDGLRAEFSCSEKLIKLRSGTNLKKFDLLFWFKEVQLARDCANLIINLLPSTSKSLFSCESRADYGNLSLIELEGRAESHGPLFSTSICCPTVKHEGHELNWKKIRCRNSQYRPRKRG